MPLLSGWICSAAGVASAWPDPTGEARATRAAVKAAREMRILLPIAHSFL